MVWLKLDQPDHLLRLCWYRDRLWRGGVKVQEWVWYFRGKTYWAGRLVLSNNSLVVIRLQGRKN